MLLLPCGSPSRSWRHPPGLRQGGRSAGSCGSHSSRAGTGADPSGPSWWYPGLRRLPAPATQVPSSQLRAVPLCHLRGSGRMDYFCCCDTGKSDGRLVVFVRRIGWCSAQKL